LSRRSFARSIHVPRSCRDGLTKALWENAAEANKDQELIRSVRVEVADAQLVELVWAIAMYIDLGKIVVFSGIERDS